MNCPNCDVAMNLIPGGISKKNNKPYKAFYSCPECKGTLNPETVIETHKPPTPTPHKTNGMDDDFGYKCNALNNATALMRESMRLGSTFTKTELELYYHDCLSLLKK